MVPVRGPRRARVYAVRALNSTFDSVTATVRIPPHHASGTQGAEPTG